MEHITHGVDIGHVGLFLFIHLELAVALCNNSSICQIEACSDSISSNGEHNCVVSVTLFIAVSVSPGHSDGTILLLTSQALRGASTDKLSVIESHVLTNQVCHILIESSEQD